VYAFLYMLFATYRSRSFSAASSDSFDHRGLDGVAPGDVLQRKSVRVLSLFGQKRMAQCVKASVRIESNLITGWFSQRRPISDSSTQGWSLWSGWRGLVEHVTASGLGRSGFREPTLLPG
jgi:hypothetical protein